MEFAVFAAGAVYAEVLLSGRGKGSGAPIELATYVVSEFRDDGRIARVRYFTEQGEALEAAGLA